MIVEYQELELEIWESPKGWHWAFNDYGGTAHGSLCPKIDSKHAIAAAKLAADHYLRKYNDTPSCGYMGNTPQIPDTNGPESSRKWMRRNELDIAATFDAIRWEREYPSRQQRHAIAARRRLERVKWAISHLANDNDVPDSIMADIPFPSHDVVGY